MERLTFEGNFCDIAQCREIPCPYNGACSQRKVWERLKAYEDTGLTPELVQETAELAVWVHENGLDKIKEWIKADNDGYLVVLPCKVGDTVWITGSVRRLYSEKVRTFFCGNPSYGRGRADNTVQMIRTTGCDIPIHEFGKTVFFAREEAEKALEEME